MSHSDDLKKAHNDGQTDASEGKYEPPHSSITTLSSFFVGSCQNFREELEENEAYDEGHAHTESQKDSNCFLTTACVNYAGLADDCHELTTLRAFRDGYVASLAHGPAKLAEYYEVAPVLVQKIEQGENRDAELADIFIMVARAVQLIEHGNYVAAFTCYETMFTNLKARYCLEI